MDVRHELSASLPPPCDDEPAGLRDDIQDELADHLGCAYRRELLRGDDASAARQRVLDRFGDPAALARRLWLEAMRGKIMTQRILIAACLLLAVASISFCGVVYLQASRAMAQAALARENVAAALAKAQETNQEMLKKLADVSATIRNPRSPGWNPVTLKLTRETPDGPPVANVRAMLSRQWGNPPQSIERTSNADGEVDFGLLEPGDYSIAIPLPFPGGRHYAQPRISVAPGSEVHKSIVCPAASPEKAPVRVKWTWPADLEAKDLAVHMLFSLKPRSFQPDVAWLLFYDAPWAPPEARNWIYGPVPPLHTTPAAHSILCGPGQALAEVQFPVGLVVWAPPSRIEHKNFEEVVTLGPGILGQILTADLHESIANSQALSWEVGEYELKELVILRPAKGYGSGSRKQFEVVAAVQRPTFSRPVVRVSAGPPFASPADNEFKFSSGFLGQQLMGTGGGRVTAWSRPTVIVPEDFWSKHLGAFEASPGHISEWTIAVPDELIKAARAQLAARAKQVEK